MKLSYRYEDENPGDGAGSGAGGDPGGTGDIDNGGGGNTDSGAGGDTGGDWRASLPEDIREATSLKDVSDVSSLAKQFVDQQQFLGNSIRVPSEEAGQKDWDAFYEKVERRAPELMRKSDLDTPEARSKMFSTLGKPKEATDYQAPEGVPEGMLTDELLGEYRAAAFKNNMTKEQFSGFLQDVIAPGHQRAVEANNERVDGIKQLQVEMGVAWGPRSSRILRVMEENGFSPGLQDAVKNGNLSAEDWRAFDKMGEALGHEGSQIVNQQGSNEALTPAEARERADEILNRLDDMEQGSP
ncbi:MAG: hypothetical protein DRJ15_14205, partial [Bacteroidetes bacterium]